MTCKFEDKDNHCRMVDYRCPFVDFSRNFQTLCWYFKEIYDQEVKIDGIGLKNMKATKEKRGV